MSRVGKDLLPLSLVAHTVFCPRRAWLEAAGEHADSVAMEHGVKGHRRVDARADDRVTRRRSVDVTDPVLGLVGRCDVVEEDGSGVRVIEFKASPLRGVAEVTPAQEVQLALQGMCLEAMGHQVTGHAVHFTTQHRTVEVPMSEGKRRRACEFVELTREVVASEHAPLPLVDDPRCRRCSHVGVCLPDENRGAIRSRTVSIRDPDGQVLHITTPGSRASLKAGRVVVRTGADELSSIPLERVQGLVVHGNADVSSALIRELLWRRVSIVWASFRGRVIGFAQSTESPNGAARIHQRCLSESQALALGRESVSSKVANQATQLRRSARADVSNEVHRLRDIAKAMSEAPDVRYLLGLEGEAAAVYFSRFTCMMHPDRGRLFIDRWPGREGRGACDPLNVALNVAYSALLADVLRSVAACGLDAHAGFLHSSSRNKPAFALDLMEQFRPVVAESAVLSAINNGELKASMFIDVMGSFRISDAGRRALLAAYERRVEQRFRHPVFGYRVTWRRAMEVQARMVLSVVDGTQRRYRGVRTR